MGKQERALKAVSRNGSWQISWSRTCVIVRWGSGLQYGRD